MELIPKTVHAPEIGQVWLNSPPLTLKELRGRVVLLDFWDYTCVNCIRTLPYLKAWHERYHARGLTTIGVHAPEFTFSRTRANVESAITAFGLPYPVVLDNDYSIWQAFANKVWPTKYLIDKDGYIRFFTMGEGNYDSTEEAIQQLLLDADPRQAKFPPLLTPLRDLDRPGALQYCRRPTPELYCGAARGRVANPEGLPEGKLTDYRYGETAAAADLLELDGWWLPGRECLAAAASVQDSRGSRLRVTVSAAEANLVAAPSEQGPGRFVATLNGQALGETRVDRPRMYPLFAGEEFRSGVLEIETRSPGLEFYALTFVGCMEKPS